MVENNINKHLIATFTFTIQDVDQSTFRDSAKEIKLNNKRISLQICANYSFSTPKIYCTVPVR